MFLVPNAGVLTPSLSLSSQMRFGLRRLFMSIGVFCIVLGIYPSEASLAWRGLTAAGYAGIVLLIQWQNTIPIIIEVLGAVLGIFAIGPILRDSVFEVRDGSYFLSSVLPGRIWGAVVGWFVVVVAIRIHYWRARKLGRNGRRPSGTKSNATRKMKQQEELR